MVTDGDNVGDILNCGYSVCNIYDCDTSYLDDIIDYDEFLVSDLGSCNVDACAFYRALNSYYSSSYDAAYALLDNTFYSLCDIYSCSNNDPDALRAIVDYYPTLVYQLEVCADVCDLYDALHSYYGNAHDAAYYLADGTSFSTCDIYSCADNVGQGADAVAGLLDYGIDTSYLNNTCGVPCSLTNNCCPAGSYADAGSPTGCTLCPPGYYQPSPGMSSCIPCPMGAYIDTFGATQCAACPPGTANAFVGQDHCTACPVGKYSDTYGDTICTTCPLGTTSNIGSTSCTAIDPCDTSTLTILSTVVFDPRCHDDSSGFIYVTSVSGGTPPYQYSIDTGTTFQSYYGFENLGAGTYDIVVKDTNGCQTADTSIVLNNPPAVTVDVVVTDDTCGDGNGAIVLTGGGGSGGVYNYSIDNGGSFDTSGTFTGLSAGTYDIVVGDGPCYATTQATVNSLDTIPPVVVYCPNDTTVFTDPGQCTIAFVNNEQPVFSDNCSTPNLEVPIFGALGIGTKSLTFKATDGSGNTSTCRYSIIVEDNEPPVAVCQDITTQVDSNGMASITPQDVDGGSTDNCAVDSISIDFSAFDCLSVPSPSPITLTVWDAGGNSSSCTAAVTVEDNIKPTAICKDITVYLDENGQGSYFTRDLDGGSSDNCSVFVEDDTVDVDCYYLGVTSAQLIVSQLSFDVANEGDLSVCYASLTTIDTFNRTTYVDTTLACGDSLFVGGAWQTNEGVYYDTMQTVYGCNSIRETTLTITDCGCLNTVQVSDTILLHQAKSTSLQSLNINNATSAQEFGQYFEAPQPITISGFNFYAYKLNATGGITQNVTCKIFEAGPDSLPTTLLGSIVVVLDTTFGGGDLNVLRKTAIFNPPIVVTGPYILTVENNSPNGMGAFANNLIAADGNSAWLANLNIFGTWLRSYNVNVGGVPFDADFIVEPFVSYELKADFSFDPECLDAPGTLVSFTNNSSPIVESQVYNHSRFIGSPIGYTWDFGDGSPTDNTISPAHLYSSIGLFNPILTTTLSGWTGIFEVCATDSLPLCNNPCDSIITVYKNVTLCLGDSFFVGGAWQTSNGTYNDTLTAANGCDSICETTLIIPNCDDGNPCTLDKCDGGVCSNTLQTTHVVTSTADSGPGTLRDLVACASPGDTITFSPAIDGDTIVLTSGQITVNKNLTIIGNNACNTIIDGNHSSRIFEIASDNGNYTVNLHGLTVQNGNEGSNVGGGILKNNGTLAITQSTFSGNSASQGGGIFNVSGNLVITQSTFSGNSASYGGGILNSSGNLAISQSTFSGNSAQLIGGGILNSSGNLAISQSTFSGNSAAFNGGGGIYNSANLTIHNSIIAGNTAPDGPDGYNDGGTIDASSSYNLIANNSDFGIPAVNGNIIGADPMLDSLADNGGCTPTMALQCGSPAIDAADSTITDNDQRDSAVFNGRRDIGAYELQQNCPVDCEVSEWSEFGPCTETCGGGIKIRTRTIITQPEFGGTSCPLLADTMACNEQPCPVDCFLGDWSEWSACDTSCGGGQQFRTRPVLVYPAFGGLACGDTIEYRPCNEQPCDPCAKVNCDDHDPCTVDICNGGICTNTPAGSSVTSFMLVNSQANTDIRLLNSSDTVKLSCYPKINVVALTCGAVQSVKFKLNSNNNFRTENEVPYTLTGDAPPFNYYDWNPAPGLYTITATPYSGNGASGTAGTTETVNLLVLGTNVPCAPQCTDSSDCNDGLLCTIDACIAGICTNNPVNVDDNDACTIDVCNPSTGTITHNPKNCDDGNACTIDGCNPATGCTHTPKNCDDNNACTVDACDGTGQCTHTALICNDNNPCTIDSCSGTVGCIFTPISNCGNCGLSIVSFTLVNAATNADIAPLTNGYVINLATTPSISIRANECEQPVGSVKLQWTGPFNGTKVENIAPYTIAGDNAGDYHPWNAPVGFYSLTATPYTGGGTGGTAGTPLTVNFQIINQALPGCTSNADCDDGKPCTIDSCAGGECINIPVAIDDGDACTVDACNPATGAITHTTVNCDDSNPCTVDHCDDVLGCVHDLIAGCCTTNGDCDDGDPCTIDICDGDTCLYIQDTSSSGSSYLRVVNYQMSWRKLKLGYSPTSLWVPQQNVIADGNNMICVTLRTVGTPEWSKIQIRPQGTSSSAITLSNYIAGALPDWTTICIPLSDFTGYNFSSISMIEIPYSNGAGAFEIHIQKIEFTGGTTPFLWFGDPKTDNYNDGQSGSGSALYAELIEGTPCASASKMTRRQDEIEDNEGELWTNAYPNPFSNQVRIEYRLAEDARIKVELYGIDGRLIYSLFEGDVKAGELQTIEMKAGSLASGMYYYRIVTSTGDILTKKLMLVR